MPCVDALNDENKRISLRIGAAGGRFTKFHRSPCKKMWTFDSSPGPTKPFY